MAGFTDTFIFPVPKKELKNYLKTAKMAAQIFKKCGAKSYTEFRGDKLQKGKVTSYIRSVKAKPSEVVVLGVIHYNSKAHRDKVYSKVMKHQNLMKAWESLPIDGMRMIFGSFTPVVKK